MISLETALALVLRLVKDGQLRIDPADEIVR
jgi:hypothetical protein